MKKFFSNKMIIISIVSIFIITSVVGTFLLWKSPVEKKATVKSDFVPYKTTSTKEIAQYNGGTVTEGEAYKRINIHAFFSPAQANSFKMNDTNRLLTEIGENVAATKYAAAKIKDTDDLIKNVKKQIAEADQVYQSQHKKSLKDAINGKGFTMADLEEFILSQDKLLKYLDSKFINQKYDFTKVRHLLVAVNEKDDVPGLPKRKDSEAKKRIEEVKKKLDAGGDFNKLVKEYSDDPGSKDKGGVYEGGPDLFKSFEKTFRESCEKLPLNKNSDPIKTNFGYHIITVLERSQKTYKDADIREKQFKRTEEFRALLKTELGFKSLLEVKKPEPKKGEKK